MVRVVPVARVGGRARGAVVGAAEARRARRGARAAELRLHRGRARVRVGVGFGFGSRV